MRTINDIPMTNFSFPEPGKHLCRCVQVKKVNSKSGNSGIELTWVTHNGESFMDNIWITGKALGRLVCIAKRLCKGVEDLTLSDDDDETAEELAVFIMQNIYNVDAIVEIVSYTETFMHESGDKIGQKETKTKKRVAFAGYEAATNEDIPF